MRVFKFKVTTIEAGKVVNHYTSQDTFENAKQVIARKYPSAIVLCVNISD